MSKTVVTIGPADHGRRMTLEEFEPAEGREGYLYELSRGIVTVMDVPKPRHLVQVAAARCQFVTFQVNNPGRIFTIAAGGECKILLAGFQSERHPDLAVYKTPPAEDLAGDESIWATWIPEIVLEIVSPGSEHRDYVEKREEYLQFGVQEYWILDARHRREMLVLRRSRGGWVERVVRPPDAYRTRLLPGLAFSCGDVFDVAQAAKG